MSTASQLIEKQFVEAGIPVRHTKDGGLMVRCHDATYEYLTGDRPVILVEPRCRCLQRPYPHELSVHNKEFESPGTYETWDLRIRFAPEGMRWPWTLRFAPRMG
jgi:hypothetical protein